MIFVTVGTHEQQFNRLVEYMDRYALTTDEEIIIQSGFSTYKPQNCKWEKFFPYEKMIQNISEARIVVTHGGPSSFIAPLQIGKTPVVVPRMKKFGEHVNDHQIMFCREVAIRQGNIIKVERIDELENIINRYDEIVGGMKKKMECNNIKFCDDFSKIVEKLF